MPYQRVVHGLLLPELRLLRQVGANNIGLIQLYVEKTSTLEVCRRCASPCAAVYDHRWTRAKDVPLHAKRVLLHIRKRRFWCPTCRKPFTEPVPGLRPYARTTERFRKSILWACERFSDLKAVRDTYRCSAGYLYKTLYAELERRRRTRLYPWPKIVGIDEHFFKRGPYGRQFVSSLLDYKNRRLMEVVEGRTSAELEKALDYIPGRENVRTVVLDLADPFKNFAKRFFPNAHLVADKFHVLRLLHPAINRYRKAITGDKRTLPARKLLLKAGHKLTRRIRWAIQHWLQGYPDLAQLYFAKEALHRFYRTKGFKRARAALNRLTDTLALSEVPELKTLRSTLLKWRREILAYFHTRVTNGPLEGFNNKAKVVKRRAYGYKSFENYRLRLLNACS